MLPALPEITDILPSLLCKFPLDTAVGLIPRAVSDTQWMLKTFAERIGEFRYNISSYNHFTQFSSVAQSCLTLCDPMDRSTPGHPVHHQLPEFTQTHVHGVGDAIQPSHLLSSPPPPAPNPSQQQGLFQ